MPKLKKTKLDSLARTYSPLTVDLPLARYVLKNKRTSTFYSKKGLTQSFFTDDSKLYFEQEDLARARKGEEIFFFSHALDSIASRSARQFTPEYLYWKLMRRRARRSLRNAFGANDELYDRIRERYATTGAYLRDFLSGSVPGISMSRVWNVSIISSIIFGMFLMTMIYRYLGQGVLAGGKLSQVEAEAANGLVKDPKATQAAATDGNSSVEDAANRKEIKQLVDEHEKKLAEAQKGGDFEEEIRRMTKGYPIEKMAPLIAKKNRTVAAFMVAIAKKESNWGKRVPVNDGKDCYNYWGFRAKRKKMGTGGHTCFDSPKDAVDSVAKRMENLIFEEKYDTPKKMVSPWKCGYDCSWDKPTNVNKWVSDVEQYYNPLKAKKK